MQQLFIQFIHYVWYLLHVSALRCHFHATRHNTPIYNILSTAPQLSISQKALGTLPEDGNVTPKHVGATIHNTAQQQQKFLVPWFLSLFLGLFGC
jgi:hypothetical protein